MKNLTSLSLVILVLGFLVTPLFAGNDVDQDLTKKISEVLTECKKVKPGMTRAQLLRIFTVEGGISTITHRTFVHRRCGYIKVDVEFFPQVPFFQRIPKQQERATDVVKEVSKPYLEWCICD